MNATVPSPSHILGCALLALAPWCHPSDGPSKFVQTEGGDRDHWADAPLELDASASYDPNVPAGSGAAQCEHGIESTVVGLRTEGTTCHLTLYRRGALPRASLEDICSQVGARLNTAETYALSTPTKRGPDVFDSHSCQASRWGR